MVRAGMNVLAAILEDYPWRLCSPRYEHDRARQATRGGHTEGELPFGGRRGPDADVPRMRSGGAGRVSTGCRRGSDFTDSDPLTPRAMGRWCSASRQRQLRPLALGRPRRA